MLLLHGQMRYAHAPESEVEAAWTRWVQFSLDMAPHDSSTKKEKRVLVFLA